MEIGRELLKKYWSGQCDPEEERAVEAWLAGGVPPGEYPPILPEGEARVKEQLWNRIRSATRPAVSRRNVFFLKKWAFPAGIAASLLIAAAFFFNASVRNEREAAKLSYRTVEVPAGKKVRLILPDSTVVHLNAGSTLRYPSVFGKVQRRVILEGEGFFSVSRDPARPFIVETGATRAMVLGTRFSLRCYGEENATSLVVEQGSVEFTATGCPDTLILTADRRGVFDSGEMELSVVDFRQYTAWKDNVIIFNDIRLADAIKELERWYGVDILIKDAGIGAYRIRGRFRDVPLAEVLREIAFTTNIRYTINDKTITLYNK